MLDIRGHMRRMGDAAGVPVSFPSCLLLCSACQPTNVNCLP